MYVCVCEWMTQLTFVKEVLAGLVVLSLIRLLVCKQGWNYGATPCLVMESCLLPPTQVEPVMYFRLLMCPWYYCN